MRDEDWWPGPDYWEKAESDETLGLGEALLLWGIVSVWMFGARVADAFKRWHS